MQGCLSFQRAAAAHCQRNVNDLGTGPGSRLSETAEIQAAAAVLLRGYELDLSERWTDLN